MTNDKMSAINDLLRIQGYNGNWNYDPYMQGLYNGMEVVIAILEDREPVFKSAPEKWLHDHKDTVVGNTIGSVRDDIINAFKNGADLSNRDTP